MLAAERLFADRRFHEVTLDEVAKAAGVGKGTIYLHFADKEDLFLQVATSGFTELCRIIEHDRPEGMPFHERLLAVCRQISAFFQRRRRLLRMMQAEDGHLSCQPGAVRERWLAHRRQLVVALGTILATGVREGVIRPDTPPEALAAFLLGMLRTRARELDDPDLVPLEGVVALFIEGAAGRVPGSTPGA
jgi:AcrR family transcriptional regulator